MATNNKTVLNEVSLQFKNVSEQEAQSLLGLVRVPDFLPLANWLNNKQQATDAERAILQELQVELSQYALYWSEEDLKMNFVSPLLRLVKLNGTQHRAFFEAKLTETINNIKLSGKVDMVVATGLRKPIQPFFFFHEYKPELEAKAEPQGQLLTAMLVGQTKNKPKIPIFGCFCVGQLWYFMVLQNQQYSISRAFNASNEADLIAIFQMLRAANVEITQMLGN